MATTDQAPEQKTMEEILASIRRIISDDEARKPDRSPPGEVSATPPPSPGPVPRPAESAASNREKVSRLFGLQRSRTADPELPRRPASEQRAVDAPVNRAIGEDKPATKPGASPRPAAGRADQSPFRPADRHRPLELAGDEDDHEPLPRVVRPEQPREAPQPLVSAATEAAVAGSLEELARAARSAGGRPLATLVEQTLRPMLKSWLDENLPTLVERLVREELDRISRGHR